MTGSQQLWLSVVVLGIVNKSTWDEQVADKSDQNWVLLYQTKDMKIVV